jgi:ProP effector
MAVNERGKARLRSAATIRSRRLQRLPAVPDNQTPADPNAAPEILAHAPVADLPPAACAAKLAELFPALFGPGAPRPLKLRVQADIQQRAPGVFTKRSLGLFLQRHTTSTAYLRALANAPQRVDLDGLAAGDVADEHRQAAVVELERRRALHEARRAAEREAQRHAFDEARRQAFDEARRKGEADDRARGDRAALLRAYETTTLTRANFCALKGLDEAVLDALLVQARQEREQRAQALRHDRPQARPEVRRPRPDSPHDRPPRGPKPPR